MNAVERLLAHAERAAAFFDEVLSPKADLDPQVAASVHRRLSAYTDGGPYMPPTFELKNAPPGTARLSLLGGSTCSLDGKANKR